MDNNIPGKALTFIILLAGAAIAIATYAAILMNWSQVSWFPILVFFVLIILADSFPVTLPRGGSVTVSFAVNAASILLFQPFMVILISVAYEIFQLFRSKNRIKHFFNTAQLTTSAGLAAIVYGSLIPITADISLSHIPAFVASMAVLSILNHTFVTLILSFIEKEKPYTIWLVNIKWCTLTFVSMAPLGAFIAVIYINIGFWGLVLFLLPMILARHTFQSYMNMRETFLDTIKSLSLAIDAKDPYTKGHSSRVADYVTSLAAELKWPADRIEFLQYISLIHDVGKVAVPENILKKDSLLTENEYDIMKKHSAAGAEVIKDVKYFAAGSNIIRHHHERWDGTGYPDRIKGEDIPEGARILAVADAFDAMTTDRPYRKALDPKFALKELQDCAGTQFDPKVVEAFVRLYPKADFNMSHSEDPETVTKGQAVFHSETIH